MCSEKFIDNFHTAWKTLPTIHHVVTESDMGSRLVRLIQDTFQYILVSLIQAIEINHSAAQVRSSKIIIHESGRHQLMGTRGVGHSEQI